LLDDAPEPLRGAPLPAVERGDVLIDGPRGLRSRLGSACLRTASLGLRRGGGRPPGRGRAGGFLGSSFLGSSFLGSGSFLAGRFPPGGRLLGRRRVLAWGGRLRARLGGLARRLL